MQTSAIRFSAVYGLKHTRSKTENQAVLTMLREQARAEKAPLAELTLEKLAPFSANIQLTDTASAHKWKQIKRFLAGPPQNSLILTDEDAVDLVGRTVQLSKMRAERTQLLRRKFYKGVELLDLPDPETFEKVNRPNCFQKLLIKIGTMDASQFEFPTEIAQQRKELEKDLAEIEPPLQQVNQEITGMVSPLIERIVNNLPGYVEMPVVEDRIAHKAFNVWTGGMLKPLPDIK